MVRVAVALGKSIAEVEQFSSTEISEWIAADRVGLLPDPWKQTAQICTVIAQGWLKRKDRKQWTIEDFMPTPRRRKRMSAKEIFAHLDAHAARVKTTRG
jgi:hypothetical protein